MIEPIVKRVGGIDVHKGIVVVTVLKEDDEGGIGKETKEYRTYWKELREMAGWLKKEEVELVVMESTGVYWKCGDERDCRSGGEDVTGTGGGGRGGGGGSG